VVVSRGLHVRRSRRGTCEEECAQTRMGDRGKRSNKGGRWFLDVVVRKQRATPKLAIDTQLTRVDFQAMVGCCGGPA
jgi:hypothetical protein